MVSLVAALLLTSLPPAQAAPAPDGISNVVPFLGVAVGWSHRNRVYRDAEAFIDDRNAYYNSLRDTARRQLAEREIGGLRTSQVAAYTKLVALIEQQRQAELAMAEARKREAREAFHRRIEGVLLQRVLGTDALQRLFGAMTRGVNRGQGLIDAALDKLSGGAGGILAEAERIRRIARDVESVAGMIGGPTGERLRRTAGRIASTIERPQQAIKADLERARDEIGQLGELVDTLARSGRTPSAGALAQGILLRPPGGSDDPAVEAITALLSRLAVSDGSLRGQARAAIQAGFVARCTALANSLREALARLDTDADALAPPSSVCHAINPNDLIEMAQQTATAEAGETTAEEPVGTQAAEAPPGEERCSLAGEGDFVIESLVVSSVSNSCDDQKYPFGISTEPLLGWMATAGRWVIVSDSAEGPVWQWQATSDLQGATVNGTARISGGALEIDVDMYAPPSGSSSVPWQRNRNGLALAAVVPLIPLASVIASRKRRRLVHTALVAAAFLLMAQSCDVYGSFSGHYVFPIPENGFACEIAPDNPNLAEMPASSGQVSLEITIADDNSVETCTSSATVGGLGVLKRDGIITEDTLAP
ncbi:MAG TPA: hypothetical protein VLD63_14485, partial [Anaerolineales bacterium]|nr:hypothetical protein [Anaerolineales bacterium]